MKKGKEPMRTFGDLMQFFEAKTDDKKPPKKGQKPKDAQSLSPSGDAPAELPAGEAVPPPADPPPPGSTLAEEANPPGCHPQAQARPDECPAGPDAVAAEVPVPSDEAPPAAAAGE